MHRNHLLDHFYIHIPKIIKKLFKNPIRKRYEIILKQEIENQIF